MQVGTLRLEFILPGSRSLKDKRRISRSLKERLHRDFACSVAEIEHQDDPRRLVLGVAMVAADRDGAHLQAVLNRILDRARMDAEARFTWHEQETY